MKANELRQKSREELQSFLEVEKKRLEELEVLLHQKKAKDVKERSRLRKVIARVHTLLRERKDSQ